MNRCVELYAEAIEKLKNDDDQDEHDFLARRLYDMTGYIVMALMLLDDATNCPEEFTQSAHVFVRMAEEICVGAHAYIMNFSADALENFKA